MKILTHLWEKTLLYKIYSVFKFLYYYIYDISNFGDILYGEDFTRILRQYLYSDFKMDWIGRIYGIVNPNLDKNHKYDPNRVIIEFDNETTHSNTFCEVWIMKQLNLCKNLFKLDKLYDFIALDIKQVPPIGYDNYLLIFSFVSQKNLIKNIKSTFWHVLVYSIIAAIVLLIIL